jgi:hypothetical protein
MASTFVKYFMDNHDMCTAMAKESFVEIPKVLHLINSYNWLKIDVYFDTIAKQIILFNSNSLVLSFRRAKATDQDVFGRISNIFKKGPQDGDAYYHRLFYIGPSDGIRLKSCMLVSCGIDFALRYSKSLYYYNKNNPMARGIYNNVYNIYIPDPIVIYASETNTVSVQRLMRIIFRTILSRGYTKSNEILALLHKTKFEIDPSTMLWYIWNKNLTHLEVDTVYIPSPRYNHKYDKDCVVVHLTNPDKNNKEGYYVYHCIDFVQVYLLTIFNDMWINVEWAMGGVDNKCIQRIWSLLGLT